MVVGIFTVVGVVVGGLLTAASDWRRDKRRAAQRGRDELEEMCAAFTAASFIALHEAAAVGGLKGAAWWGGDRKSLAMRFHASFAALSDTHARLRLRASSDLCECADALVDVVGRASVVLNDWDAHRAAILNDAAAARRAFEDGARAELHR